MEGRGWEVLAADSIALASELTTRRGFRPALLLVDDLGLDADPDGLEALSFLRGSTPLLLITTSSHDPSGSSDYRPTATLARPVTIGQIANSAASML